MLKLFSITSLVQIFPSVLSTLLVGQQEGYPACKKLGVGLLVDNLTGTLHVLQLQLSPPPTLSLVAPMKSKKETFWCQLRFTRKWLIKQRKLHSNSWNCRITSSDSPPHSAILGAKLLAKVHIQSNLRPNVLWTWIKGTKIENYVDRQTPRHLDCLILQW